MSVSLFSHGPWWSCGSATPPHPTPVPLQSTKSLIDMSTDPKWCTYAYLDSDVAVPEIVLSCVMFLRHGGHIPGACVPQ